MTKVSKFIQKFNGLLKMGGHQSKGDKKDRPSRPKARKDQGLLVVDDDKATFDNDAGWLSNGLFEKKLSSQEVHLFTDSTAEKNEVLTNPIANSDVSDRGLNCTKKVVCSLDNGIVVTSTNMTELFEVSQIKNGSQSKASKCINELNGHDYITNIPSGDNIERFQHNLKRTNVNSQHATSQVCFSTEKHQPQSITNSCNNEAMTTKSKSKVLTDYPNLKKCNYVGSKPKAPIQLPAQQNPIASTIRKYETKKVLPSKCSQVVTVSKGVDKTSCTDDKNVIKLQDKFQADIAEDITIEFEKLNLEDHDHLKKDPLRLFSVIDTNENTQEPDLIKMKKQSEENRENDYSKTEIKTNMRVSVFKNTNANTISENHLINTLASSADIAAKTAISEKETMSLNNTSPTTHQSKQQPSFTRNTSIKVNTLESEHLKTKLKCIIKKEIRKHIQLKETQAPITSIQVHPGTKNNTTGISEAHENTDNSGKHELVPTDCDSSGKRIMIELNRCEATSQCPKSKTDSRAILTEGNGSKQHEEESVYLVDKKEQTLGLSTNNVAKDINDLLNTVKKTAVKQIDELFLQIKNRFGNNYAENEKLFIIKGKTEVSESPDVDLYIGKISQLNYFPEKIIVLMKNRKHGRQLTIDIKKDESSQSCNVFYLQIWNQDNDTLSPKIFLEMLEEIEETQFEIIAKHLNTETRSNLVCLPFNCSDCVTDTISGQNKKATSSNHVFDQTTKLLHVLTITKLSADTLADKNIAKTLPLHKEYSWVFEENETGQHFQVTYAPEGDTLVFRAISYSGDAGDHSCWVCANKYSSTKQDLTTATHVTLAKKSENVQTSPPKQTTTTESEKPTVTNKGNKKKKKNNKRRRKKYLLPPPMQKVTAKNVEDHANECNNKNTKDSTEYAITENELVVKITKENDVKVPYENNDDMKGNKPANQCDKLAKLEKTHNENEKPANEISKEVDESCNNNKQIELDNSEDISYNEEDWDFNFEESDDEFSCLTNKYDRTLNNYRAKRINKPTTRLIKRCKRRTRNRNGKVKAEMTTKLEVRFCDACGKATFPPYFPCKMHCGTHFYCASKCFNRHWPVHKKECTKLIKCACAQNK
ncbi:uncharacterized protein [Antedon mediterranea]|uniref:uncharacterized protein n=1 Tax=Antedon mediterranea TaxID=105859 RepID=UPI003AF4F393